MFWWTNPDYKRALYFISKDEEEWFLCIMSKAYQTEARVVGMCPSIYSSHV